MTNLPIKTLDERNEVIKIIDSIISNLYKNDFRFESLPDNNLSYQLSSDLFSLISKNLNSDPSISQDNLEQIKNELLNLKTITLTIPFEADESLKNKVSNLLNENELRSVIEFKTDKTLLGGPILEANGYYKDYSIKNYLEKYFQ